LIFHHNSVTINHGTLAIIPSMRFEFSRVFALIMLGGCVGVLSAAEPIVSPAASGAPWSDLSTISFDGAFGLTLGEVIEPPAGMKQGILDVGLRFAMMPKKPLPVGWRGLVMVTKKTHKLISIFLESKNVSDSEWEALKSALTKKLGPPGPDVMGTNMPSWQQGVRGISLDRMNGGAVLLLQDLQLTGQAIDEDPQ
jgi:hypothetical protein